MKIKRKGKSSQSPRQRAWVRSSEFRAIRLAALAAINAARPTKPKCGAVAKSTGRQCGNLALENGRCRFHGGASPKGADWHRVQLTNAAGSDAKLAKKLREVDRRRKKQAARVAAMPPDERARYEEWAHTHRPMGPTAREQRRQDRAARKLLAGVVEPEDREEAAAIASTLAKLKARRNALVALDAPADGAEAENGAPAPNDGVFA